MPDDIAIPPELPLLAVRDVVLFNDMLLPLFIAREVSAAAIDAAWAAGGQVMVLAQRNMAEEEPLPEDLYQVGTVAAILKRMRLQDGRMKLLVQGLAKARAVKVAS